MPKKTKTFTQEGYYKEKKGDIAKTKKERYLTDAEYREKAKIRASANYAKKRGVDSVAKVAAGVYKINGVDYYSVQYIAQRTGFSSQLINYYVLNGFIPEPKKLPSYTKRMFSYTLAEAIISAIDMYQLKQIAKVNDLHATIKSILGDKYKELIHHACIK